MTTGDPVDQEGQDEQEVRLIRARKTPTAPGDERQSPTLEGTGHKARSLRCPAGIRWLLYAFVFALALLLGTRENRFPYYYHADEPGKAREILTGKPDYKHPLLLLGTVRQVVERWVENPSEQRAVVVGRWVSASFAAFAALLCTALGYWLRGIIGAACVGTLVLLCPPLVTYAHFLKEDTALVMGLAAFLLTAIWYSRTPSVSRVLLLGAGCGLAASAKYTGIVALPAAMGFVFACGRSHKAVGRARAAAALLAGFVAVVLIVNFPIVREFSTFLSGFTYEAKHAAGGIKGATQPILTPKYALALLRSAMLSDALRLLVLGYVGFVVATWSRRDAAERLLTVFPFGLLIFLQCFPLKAERYLLPVVVIFYTHAGLAIAEIGARGRRGRRAHLLAAVGILAVVGAIQGRSVVRHLREFEHDSRDRLRAFVLTRLPANATIAQDKYGGLPDPAAGRVTETDPVLPQRILTRQRTFQFELGTLEDLRARGVTHVAVSARFYNRYQPHSAHYPSKEARRQYERAQAFYGTLFREGHLLWEAAGSAIIRGAPVNPPLRLYSIGHEGPNRDSASPTTEAPQ